MPRSYNLGGLTIEGTDGHLVPQRRASRGAYVETPSGRGILRSIAGPADGWQRWHVMVRGQERVYDVNGARLPRRRRRR